MRFDACIALAAMGALCGPALAGDLGIPIDVFPAEYRRALDVGSPFVAVPDQDCRWKVRCTLDLGGGVFLILSAADGSDAVTSAEVGVQSEGSLATDRFSAASKGLMALLSKTVPVAARNTAYEDLARRALASPTAKAETDVGSTRYVLWRRSDRTLTLAATR